jgi:hypothetical protein
VGLYKQYPLHGVNESRPWDECKQIFVDIHMEETAYYTRTIEAVQGVGGF